MAEIPVERKSGFPGWLIALLVLALLALLAWWLLADDDEVVEEDLVDNDPVEQVAPAVVTSLAALQAIPADQLPGTEVRLDGVPVQSVESDAGYWIGTSETDRMYVLLNEVATPGTDTEGRVDVNEGSMVSLTGTVRSAAEEMPEAGLVVPDGVENYIWASDTNVVEEAS